MSPAEARRQKAADVLAIMDLRRYAEAKALIEREDTDEEDLTKLGLSDEMITAVMANIERAARERPID